MRGYTARLAFRSVPKPARRRQSRCARSVVRLRTCRALAKRRSLRLQRCALAGDQVGQGHAVGCEAGKLCKLVDTVLKGVQAPAGRNTETYDAAMASLAR